MKKFFSQNNKRNEFYTNIPQLYYASVVEDEDSIHPRFLHSHDDLVEIIFIVNGQVKYLIEDTEYDIKKGDLIVINSNVLHDETIVRDSGFKSYCLALKGVNLSSNQPNTLLPKGASPVISTHESFFEIKELFEMLMSHVQEATPSSNLIAKGICHTIVTLIFYGLIENEQQQQCEQRDKKKEDIVTKVKQFIDTNFTEDLTLAEIAESVHSSQYYIAHLFKDELGISPGQYIIRRRIGEAQTLLLTTDKNISYIASSVGYDSIHQFNTLFKRKVGLSPSAYRKEYFG
ncbi:AraC family transcriptional regulator [Enterococcus sp. AZ109]|uniref:helix-turn-helix domain-containing protein n=1 Tax=Enterococcus sp. AZ109 TaxID=2774634 RepID=UPI003F22D21B